MNNKKNILLVSTLSLVGLTLASCSKQDTRNQVVPYEGINSSKVVASIETKEAGKIEVTEKELYNNLRYTYGSEVFNKKIDTLLYGSQIENVKYEGKVKTEIDETIAQAVYNTTDLAKLKLMSKEDQELARKKFVDKMLRSGLTVKENELIFDPIDKKTENVSFSHLSKDTINYYMLSQAKKLRGESYIKEICDKEYITKDGKEIKNKYYIDDKKLESRYENNYRKHNTAKGIILRFTNAEDAYRAIEEVNGGSRVLSNVDLKQKYVELYNNYYAYETAIDASQVGVHDNTVFKTNNEVNQLKEFSDNVNTLFIDHLENGQGLLKPMNIDDKYYLIYREDVTFLTGGSKDIAYDQLDAEKKKEINAQLKQEIIDADASSVTSTIYNEDLESKELKIFDPFIENTFAGANSFYDYVTTSNNQYIFTTTDETFKYSTTEFYKDLLKYDVDSAVVELLLNKYLYKAHKSYLDTDEEKKIKDELKAEVKEFNEGKKGLNKAYGEANYLFFQYGCTTQEEVVIKKASSSIKSDYLIDFVSNSWANYKTDPASTKVLENLIESALAVLEDKKLFDINLDHILISVDNNQDGQPDNMLEFVDSLSTAEKDEFNKEISKLSKAIAKEVAAIQSHTTKEKLDYIVNAFNNNMPTADGNSWADFKKKYHFTLKAEELGNVDENSVNNFVKEFKKYVEDLFTSAVTNKLEIPSDKEKEGRLYFPNKADGTQVTVDSFTHEDLCLTQFGYHMLSINSYKKDSTELNFQFTKNQDPSNDYGNIKLILDEKDKDNKDDDIFVITDLYTPEDNKDKTKPSLNQVLVYFVEKTNGDVTSIKTSLKNNLSTLLDDVISKFKSSSFQEYLLIKSMGTITTTDLPEFNYERHLEYIKNSNESYDKDSYYYNNWYGDKFDWTRR